MLSTVTLHVEHRGSYHFVAMDGRKDSRELDGRTDFEDPLVGSVNLILVRELM